MASIPKALGILVIQNSNVLLSGLNNNHHYVWNHSVTDCCVGYQLLGEDSCSCEVCMYVC